MENIKKRMTEEDLKFYSDIHINQNKMLKTIQKVVSLLNFESFTLKIYSKHRRKTD